jgi:hypothetical protein
VEFHALCSYWSTVEYIPTFCAPIGQQWSIFPRSVLLLVSSGVYSHVLCSYWPAVEYIPTLCAPIGQQWSIFPRSVLLLVK